MYRQWSIWCTRYRRFTSMKVVLGKLTRVSLDREANQKDTSTHPKNLHVAPPTNADKENMRCRFSMKSAKNTVRRSDRLSTNRFSLAHRSSRQRWSLSARKSCKAVLKSGHRLSESIWYMVTPSLACFRLFYRGCLTLIWVRTRHYETGRQLGLAHCNDDELLEDAGQLSCVKISCQKRAVHKQLRQPRRPICACQYAAVVAVQRD